jgi:hypothetical protein
MTPSVHSAAMRPRRFPAPWSVEELDACFCREGRKRPKLGYFYYEEEPGRTINNFGGALF